MNTATTEKTGNLKCWHVLDVYGERPTKGLTRTEALAMEHRSTNQGPALRACRDGYRLVPCQGEAHRNAHIDHCMLCAPRWGVVMVPMKGDPRPSIHMVEGGI